MPCTTILVGKKASYDGSTMIARNDDNPSGTFQEKDFLVVTKDMQPKLYKTKISHIEIPLNEEPLSYTAFPNVTKENGIWAASGINSLNVGMTATETITSNPRVLGADPYTKDLYNKITSGIGEEDLVVLVLPYIKSAREGVIRLGMLLEKYGTYEPNGIAFNDKDEIWYLETIGGHHFIATKIDDDKYVSMPNQLGIDNFDLDDALGEQKKYICSKDLKEFISNNHLDINNNNKFNPRLVFGSHDDSDHVYNTPRSWAIMRYFNPRTFKWDGTDATYTPESDDIPFSLVPERKITIEDMKWALSNHFQGTLYDPYSKVESPLKNKYRSIGVNRTSLIALLQIRGYMDDLRQGVVWFSFSSNVFNQLVPFYSKATKVPSYFRCKKAIDVNTFYWANRLIGALADANYDKTITDIERYQASLMSKCHEIITKYDNIKDINIDMLNDACKEIASVAKYKTSLLLNKVLYIRSMNMKNSYQRSDN